MGMVIIHPEHSRTVLGVKFLIVVHPLSGAMLGLEGSWGNMVTSRRAKGYIEDI